MKYITFIIPILLSSLLLFSSNLLHAASNSTCQKAPLALQVLGSGGPELDDQRASSSYLIWKNGKAKVLIDIGGGAAFRFEQSGAKIEDLAAIAFTHLHVDHSADLPVLVKGAFFSSRQKDLAVFGPEGNQLLPSTTQFMQTLLGQKGVWPYLSDFLPKNTGSAFNFKPSNVKTNSHQIQMVYNRDGIKLSAISTHHGPLPALAWRVDIDEKSISFSGDMNGDLHSLEQLAKNTNMLVAHNAVPESATGVARRLHMPPSVIADIAKTSQSKQLVLSHRMKRTLGKEAQTQKIIQKHYQGSVHFANDLDCFIVK